MQKIIFLEAALRVLLLGAASVAADTTSDDANASSYSRSNSTHTQADPEDAWSWILQMLHQDKSIFSFLVFLPPGMRIFGDWFVKTVTDKVNGEAAKALSTLQAPFTEASQAVLNGEGIEWSGGHHLFIRSGHTVQEVKPKNDPPKGCIKWDWKDDTDGWVAYLPTGIEGWLVAREASGLGHRTAVAVAIAKLLLWHLLQPAMYCAALYVYWDTLGTIDSMWSRDKFGSGLLTPRNAALAVLMREVLYIILCIVGLWIAPYYLLVHPWKSDGSSPKMSNVVWYALMPDKFVFDVIIQALIMDPTATVTESAATQCLSAAWVFRGMPTAWILGMNKSVLLFVVQYTVNSFLYGFDMIGYLALLSAKVYEVTPFALIVGYALTTISLFAGLFFQFVNAHAPGLASRTNDLPIWSKRISVTIGRVITFLTAYVMLISLACDVVFDIFFTQDIANDTQALDDLLGLEFLHVQHQLQACVVDDWTASCTACWTSISLPLILGICAMPCCMKCLKTFSRVVCMLLRDADVRDADELERVRCRQRVKLLESVRVAQREGGLKTEAMGRHEKLAASARLLCAEAQTRLLRADADRACKIVSRISKRSCSH